MLIALTLASATELSAETRTARAAEGRPAGRSRLAAVLIGAGAGVGAGLAAAYAALPDASCSDMKTWVAAGSFGTLGAGIGYAVGGRNGGRTAAPARAPRTKSVRLDARQAPPPLRLRQVGALRLPD
jgi:hypothetical protein